MKLNKLNVFKFLGVYIQEHLSWSRHINHLISKLRSVLGTVIKVKSLLNKFFFLFFYFNLYIYPPDSQESDGGAIHRVGNYPDLLPEMPRYCCPLVI